MCARARASVRACVCAQRVRAHAYMSVRMPILSIPIRLARGVYAACVLVRVRTFECVCVRHVHVHDCEARRPPDGARLPGVNGGA